MTESEAALARSKRKARHIIVNDTPFPCRTAGDDGGITIGKFGYDPTHKGRPIRIPRVDEHIKMDDAIRAGK